MDWTELSPDARLALLYGADAGARRETFFALEREFYEAFGRARLCRFSAPGRSEISGNHTDHQHGRVLAAAVSLDMLAVAAPSGDDRVSIRSAGFPPFSLSLSSLDPVQTERGTSAALVRGVAEALEQSGCRPAGFSAVLVSNIPAGAGLSSSASFGILIGAIMTRLFGGDGAPLTLARAAQHAENVHFGKPSGLMDQLACAVGGFVAIDFADPDAPAVTRIDCDLAAHGHALAVVDAGGSHANLTPEYASVPEEMRLVARAFGREYLREVEPDAFFSRIGALRRRLPDRALLRAMHFFQENARVGVAARALQNGDMELLKDVLLRSGRSSFELLQNVCPEDGGERSLALALALSERCLTPLRGVCRVHGGGFAGTVQALLPLAAVEPYRAAMESAFGRGCCNVLAIRPVGGVAIDG